MVADDWNNPSVNLGVQMIAEIFSKLQDQPFAAGTKARMLVRFRQRLFLFDEFAYFSFGVQHECGSKVLKQWVKSFL